MKITKEIKSFKINGILNNPQSRKITESTPTKNYSGPSRDKSKRETETIKIKKGNKKEKETILTEEVKNPILFSVSEAAKIGGVNTKTIRRAIQGKQIKYKIINNRYFIDLAAIITFLCDTKKLENKLNYFGIGQYVKKWKK